jgi:hypothetical protein
MSDRILSESEKQLLQRIAEHNRDYGSDRTSTASWLNVMKRQPDTAQFMELSISRQLQPQDLEGGVEEKLTEFYYWAAYTRIPVQRRRKLAESDSKVSVTDTI